MDRNQILLKIREIREELAADQYRIIHDKIMERSFHVHKSNRFFLTKKMIEKFRKKLAQEIELILDPILENQKELNLRFLAEIDRLKKALGTAAFATEARNNEKKNETSDPLPEEGDGEAERD